MIFNVVKMATIDTRPKTGLMHALRIGNSDLAASLIRIGMSDVNARDEAGYPAIVWAATLGFVDVVKLLIEKGVDINAKGPDGFSALEYVKLGSKHVYSEPHKIISEILRGN